MNAQAAEAKPLRVICILNRKSRDGDAESRWPELRKLLEAADISAQVVDISHDSLTREVEDELQNGQFDLVMGIGGDGTHFAAFNVLKDIERRHPGMALPPYLPIPYGTGNNIAKSLGLGKLRRHIEDVPGIIREGQDRRIDLGQYRDRVFADSVSVGLDAYVVERRDRMREALPGALKPFVHGYLIYALAGAIGMLRAPRLQCEIVADGRPWYNGPFGNIVINNTRIYGGIFDPCPDCQDDDGVLNLVMTANRFAYATACAFSLRWMPKAVRGMKAKRPGGLHFTSVPVRELSIRLEPPAPVQIDGEVIGIRQEIDVTVLQQAITVRTSGKTLPT